MATKLTNKATGVSADSVFILDTDLESAFIITEDQRASAFDYYRAKVAKSDKGRIPESKALAAWFDAGMPNVNTDDIRKERIAVSEGAGKSWSELTDEQYNEYRQNWIDAGSPEPESFLPRGARAKLIGRVLVDGKETEDEMTIYVTGDALDHYRSVNELNGPSSTETYLAASESDWKGNMVVHTLRTTNRTIRLVNGKPVTKGEAMKAELSAMLEQAIESGDMGMLKKIRARLNA